MRKPIPKSVRKLVYQKYNGHCAYCGCEIPEKGFNVDHLHCLKHYEYTEEFTGIDVHDIKNLIWERSYILWGMTNDIPDMVEVDPATICKCTGIKDKNGKLIWENDIVNCLTEECCGYIGWNESEAGFYFNVLLEDGSFEEEHIYDYQDCIEVIGNTFDNPELLEV